ncbi:IclR family transcriptional regulator [Nocardioides sp.]|uniref:IclR family transcriptional regulator n=1 Tax=Nocardioides sp. TaxID=35761 RepID=UPI0039E625B1
MSAPVKSADRVLQILDLLTERPDGLTLVEIHTIMGIPKSSAYGLLQTMVQRGFLTQEAETRRFRVGIRLWQAGRSYLSVASIEQVALPYMRAVRDRLNETVQLAVLDGTDNVYIGKVDPDQQLRLASHVGARLPAYATGIGKALLSRLSDEEVRRRFDDVEFVAYTPRTLSGLGELLTQLAEVRERGYAVDNGEYTDGVYCVAFPLRDGKDRLHAAVSVSIPEVRKTPPLIAATVESLRQAAADISERYE